jgi:hypothetical protein
MCFLRSSKINALQKSGLAIAMAVFSIPWFFFFFFFFPFGLEVGRVIMLEIKPCALHMLDKCSDKCFTAEL